MATPFSTPQQLRELADILTRYMTLPFFDDKIPGGIREAVLAHIRGANVRFQLQELTTPSSGLLALPYNLRGIRPASNAKRPASIALFMATAIFLGSRAP